MTIVCDDCKHEFDLSSVNIEQTNIKIKDKDFVFRYFTCPKCKEIYKVSLEDEKYRELKEECEGVVKRIKRNKGNGNTYLFQSLTNMLSVKKERLKKYSDEIKEKYKGTFTFNASENNSKEIIYHEKHGN